MCFRYKFLCRRQNPTTKIIFYTYDRFQYIFYTDFFAVQSYTLVLQLFQEKFSLLQIKSQKWFGPLFRLIRPWRIHWCNQSFDPTANSWDTDFLRMLKPRNQENRLPATANWNFKNKTTTKNIIHCSVVLKNQQWCAPLHTQKMEILGQMLNSPKACFLDFLASKFWESLYLKN